METYMEILKQTIKKPQLKIDLPHNLKNFKEMFIAIQSITAKTWTQPNCRLDPPNASASLLS